jgi:hypothetical protein
MKLTKKIQQQITIEQCNLLLKHCDTQRFELKQDLLDLLNEPKLSEVERLANFKQKITHLLSEQHGQTNHWQPLKWTWLRWCLPFIGQGSKLRVALVKINESLLNEDPLSLSTDKKQDLLTNAQTLHNQGLLVEALPYYGAYFNIVSSSKNFNDIKTAWTVLKSLEDEPKLSLSKSFLGTWRPIDLSQLSWDELNQLDKIANNYSENKYIVSYFKSIYLINQAEKEVDISPIVYKLMRGIILTSIGLDPTDKKTDSINDKVLSKFWHFIEKAIFEKYKLDYRVHAKYGKYKEKLERDLAQKTQEDIAKLKDSKQESYFELLIILTKLKNERGIQLSSSHILEEFSKVFFFQISQYLQLKQLHIFDTHLLKTVPAKNLVEFLFSYDLMSKDTNLKSLKNESIPSAIVTGIIPSFNNAEVHIHNVLINQAYGPNSSYKAAKNISGDATLEQYHMNWIKLRLDNLWSLLKKWNKNNSTRYLENKRQVELALNSTIISSSTLKENDATLNYERSCHNSICELMKVINSDEGKIKAILDKIRQSNYQLDTDELNTIETCLDKLHTDDTENFIHVLRLFKHSLSFTHNTTAGQLNLLTQIKELFTPFIDSRLDDKFTHSISLINSDMDFKRFEQGSHISYSIVQLERLLTSKYKAIKPVTVLDAKKELEIAQIQANNGFWNNAMVHYHHYFSAPCGNNFENYLLLIDLDKHLNYDLFKLWSPDISTLSYEQLNILHSKLSSRAHSSYFNVVMSEIESQMADKLIAHHWPNVDNMLYALIAMEIKQSPFNIDEQFHHNVIKVLKNHDELYSKNKAQYDTPIKILKTLGSSESKKLSNLFYLTCFRLLPLMQNAPFISFEQKTDYLSVLTSGIFHYPHFNGDSDLNDAKFRAHFHRNMEEKLSGIMPRASARGEILASQIKLNHSIEKSLDNADATILTWVKNCIKSFFTSFSNEKTQSDNQQKQLQTVYKLWNKKQFSLEEIKILYKLNHFTLPTTREKTYNELLQMLNVSPNMQGNDGLTSAFSHKFKSDDDSLAKVILLVHHYFILSNKPNTGEIKTMKQLLNACESFVDNDYSNALRQRYQQVQSTNSYKKPYAHAQSTNVGFFSQNGDEDVELEQFLPKMVNYQ